MPIVVSRKKTTDMQKGMRRRVGEQKQMGINNLMDEDDPRKYPRIKSRRRMGAPGTKNYLTGGQAKIAAKAPPTNKIDAKDFAVLRAEKAKGRGKGLQDEKMKPGKVMKARQGILARLLGGKKKMVVITGMKPTDRYGQQLKPKPIKPRKKMGGGMMMQRPMGYDKGGSSNKKRMQDALDEAKDRS